MPGVVSQTSELQPAAHDFVEDVGQGPRGKYLGERKLMIDQY